MGERDDDHETRDARQQVSFWTEWFERYAPVRKSTEVKWRNLGEGWPDAVESWWTAVGKHSPVDGRQALRQCVDQGKAFFALADGVTRSAEGRMVDAAAVSRPDVLWRLPLEIWEQATADALASRTGDADGRMPDSARAYRQALADYMGMLQGVGADTLKGVSESWRARRDAAGAEAGLRELFDACVDIGEQRYHELVSSDAFAETGGRLINTFVSLVGEMRNAADGAHASNSQSKGVRRATRAPPRDAPATSDPTKFMASLGIDPGQTLAELRAFGDKLNMAVETLQDIGPIDVGTSPREAVLRDGKLTLYHYHPTAGASNPVPVLIVYALANRPYMMDLEPRRSLVRGLLDAGLDVYMVDWGYPDQTDRERDLADHVIERLGKCVQTVCDRHAVERISLLGVCQGGTFSLCYSALFPERVRNLVLMVTPVDFHTPDNLLTAWLRHVDVDRMVDVLGNIPGTLLNWAFVSMKPLKLTGQKYLDMLDVADDEDKVRTFLRMEKWIQDSPDQAGECFREFVRDLIQHNKLVEGKLRIGDRDVDLRAITMPVLNIYAAHDHIVPPAASLALAKHVTTTDYSTCEFEGGHIGIYVSARAQQKVPREIADWLHARSQSERKQSQ